MRAIASGGVRVLNEAAVSQLGISNSALNAVTARETDELATPTVNLGPARIHVPYAVRHIRQASRRAFDNGTYDSTQVPDKTLRCAQPIRRLPTRCANTNSAKRRVRREQPRAG